MELAPAAGAYSCEGPSANFVEPVGPDGGEPLAGEATIRSVLLLDAAYRSAASGRAEEVT